MITEEGAPETGGAAPAVVDAEATPVEPPADVSWRTHALTVLAIVGSLAIAIVRALALTILGIALTLGLIGGGLTVAPTLGARPVAAAGPPRPPPIIPPAVPIGAREDWALWSYVERINQAWGKDWPHVIQWFEEYNARYPGNPMVFDKLYAAYIEDGRRLAREGDLVGARQRFEQAVRFDPSRSEARDFLKELDAVQSGR